MIDFQVTGVLPGKLTPSDLKRLALLLGKTLRVRTNKMVSISFVSEKAIQALNKKYRNMDHPTDVLSFETPFIPTPKGRSMKQEPVQQGELVICAPYAKKEAQRRSIPLKEELIRLCVHGVLHLWGMDHANPKDELKMFRLQERLVEGALT